MAFSTKMCPLSYLMFGDLNFISLLSGPLHLLNFSFHLSGILLSHHLFLTSLNYLILDVSVVSARFLFCEPNLNPFMRLQKN